MSRVDLDRNRSSILKAFDEVSNPKNDTNWVLYGYEGATNVLKLVAQGDGGIEEMVDDMSSGKIMYAYCRVRDPNTDLPKFVLINWQGDGVPEMRKGSCANHITDVTKLLKGAHVTINARTEDDVDEEDILKKVSKSSGSNYSFHKEKPKPGMNAPAGPVGSVYQKTMPHREIKSDVRDQFWQQQQEEEKKRQEALQQQAAAEKQKLDKELKERELKEAQDRDSKERDRMRKIQELKLAEARANSAANADKKAEWEKTQVEALQDDEERKKRADKLRKERANEAQSLVQQRGNDPRSMFQQKPASQFDAPSRAPPPPRKLKQGIFGEEPASQFDAPKKPIQLPREEPPSPVKPEAPAAAPQAPVQRQLPPVRQPEPEPEPVVTPPTRNILAEGLPPRQDSDEEAEEQDWDASAQQPEPSTEDFTMPSVTPVVPQQADDELYDDVRAEPEPEPDQDLYDDVRQDNVADAGKIQFSPEQGLVARALYDYQATEDNEVTFDPGDIITNIDQIDPGWWVGITPDGSQGMFPSNYVEILN